MTSTFFRGDYPNINTDDTFYITLDPFNAKRSGYFFGVNPNGVRLDGLYRNVSEFYGDWDSIYYAQTSFFDGGWIAEFEIPFKSLSFDDSSDTWGLNFSRSIKSRSEDIAWVSRNRRWDPSSSGTLTGLLDLNQGLGLDIVPSVSINTDKNYINNSSDSNFEPSLDVVYKITPSLNGSLTINTDFSATEVDDRQVNLTRFSLFFPEKRDFFLRDADIFEFGRIGAQTGFGGSQNGRPFFSRNIGLGGNGEIVGLDFGAKVSGRIGRFEIGALSIRQDENQGITADNLSVVRAKIFLGEQSTAGLIFTDGSPYSNVNNSLMGFDYLYRNSNLPGGRTLEVSTWYQQSDTNGISSNDSAAGIGFSIPGNNGFSGGASYKQFEANFNPALGFVNRRGIQNSAADIAYTLRPDSGPVQSLFFSLEAERYQEIDNGELQSEKMSITPLQLTTHTGDTLFIRSNFVKEVLTSPFEISPGIIIPVGKYDFANHGIEIRSAAYRDIAASLTYIQGDFYDGEQRRLFGSVTWRPTLKIRTKIGFNITRNELSAGNFTTRVLTTGFDYVFSSTLSWVNLIQYDNVSETAGINMRLHWIPESGREFFFVINHTLEDYDQNDRFHSSYSNATIKASYTLRY